MGCVALWPAAISREEYLTPEDFFYYYKVTASEGSGWYYFSTREGQPTLISGLPSSHKRWKEKFFFVYGEGVEIAQWKEVTDQTPRISGEWGKPGRKGMHLKCFYT